MTDILFDPILGELFFDSYWEGCVSVPGLGNTVHLMIETREGPPTGPQREAFRYYRQGFSGLIPTIETAIFNYYNQVVSTYRQAIGPRFADKMAPILESPSEIWSLLSDPGILILPNAEHELRITLLWECTWDVEHGLQAELRGKQVTQVGIQP
jgi:hypothetical protein